MEFGESGRIAGNVVPQLVVLRVRVALLLAGGGPAKKYRAFIRLRYSS